MRASNNQMPAPGNRILVIDARELTMKFKSLRVLGLVVGLSCASGPFAANIAAAEDCLARWCRRSRQSKLRQRRHLSGLSQADGSSLIRFDLFSYAGDRRIVKANLLLKVTKVARTSARCACIASRVHGRKQWSPRRTIRRWPPRPLRRGRLRQPMRGKTISIDVSSTVRTWFATPTSNLGFNLVAMTQPRRMSRSRAARA